MFFVSERMSTAPESFSNDVQRLAYEALEKLGISYERVDTDEAISMEKCALIDDGLGAKIVKTLLVCDRRQTEFYLFITTGGKAFKSHDFSAALGISRVSFAPSEKLEELIGVKVGAATVLGALLPSAGNVHIVFDKDVLADELFACSDGTPTGFVKFKTADLLERFLPYTGHDYVSIDF